MSACWARARARMLPCARCKSPDNGDKTTNKTATTDAPMPPMKNITGASKVMVERGFSERPKLLKPLPKLSHINMSQNLAHIICRWFCTLSRELIYPDRLKIMHWFYFSSRLSRSRSHRHSNWSVSLIEVSVRESTTWHGPWSRLSPWFSLPFPVSYQKTNSFQLFSTSFMSIFGLRKKWCLET